MTIRPYAAADLPALVALFTASVHELGAAHYDKAQRLAWAPLTPDLAAWAHRLAELHTWVADADGVLTGFMAYAGNGHIDLLYTAPGLQRSGVATRLYQQAEKQLRGQALFTEASLVAKPFFLRQGFQVAEVQWVERQGVVLQRFLMRKPVL
ncbi:MAG: GNAT family N-acetyltransferase [Proteobacteria bacterium]|nr:GNAT family N-acetyltransferase [Pseudomonadota bacterium]